MDNRVSLDEVDYSPLVYKSEVEHDCDELAIAKASIDELSAVFPDDVSAPKRLLAAGTSLDTEDLHISLRIEPLSVATSAGSIETPHLVLDIQNRTDHAVAYRVDTSINASAQTCVAKADYKHDAIALLPHETQSRTECVAGNESAITVDRVESIRIPLLSYYYVSKVNPADIGENRLVTRGHQPPHGVLCQVPDSANRALERGRATWRDIIDFYSRHNCSKYSFFLGYKAFQTANERPLPARL